MEGGGGQGDTVLNECYNIAKAIGWPTLWFERQLKSNCNLEKLNIVLRYKASGVFCICAERKIK